MSGHCRERAASGRVNQLLTFEASVRQKRDMGALVDLKYPKAHERSRTPRGRSITTRCDVSPSYLVRDSLRRGRVHFARRHRVLVLSKKANGCV